MDTKNEIVELIAGVLEVPASKIDEDTAIGDVENWDSLRQLQIIAAIEGKYGFRFDPEVIMDLEDVSDIIAAVEERV